MRCCPTLSRSYLGQTLSCSPRYASTKTSPPAWRPATTLDSWVAREARPISLRQLTVFGRTLTESRLLSSANYVRSELPTRLAHRLRDLQTLPYSALRNPHINHVYELYYSAFDKLRQIPEIHTLEQNDNFCKIIKERLLEHLTVIPRLAMGVLQIKDYFSEHECDRLMTALLRSRISRRVIGEQHIALTRTFYSTRGSQPLPPSPDHHEEDSIGQVLLKCHARETIDKCTATIRDLMHQTYGHVTPLPAVILEGHLDTTFPYIPSQLEYIIGELLRNSMQAVITRHGSNNTRPPAPIQVLICESPDHVIIRVSDQGGGIHPDILPNMWSFAAKGHRAASCLENLERVPRLVGSMQELSTATGPAAAAAAAATHTSTGMAAAAATDASLSKFTSRPPDLKLGLGLPLSRVYAEYWAGRLEIHSLDGFGTDAFLQLSKFGNRNETLSTRASMDCV